MDNEQGTMASITTQEIKAIQRMMGAQTGAIDPYPIGKSGLFDNHTNGETGEVSTDEEPGAEAE